ncbi:hypothetical protein ACNI3K_08930 [Demequina sp. SO4-13]|uniref:hypothetical protein n=1 Tax=Demequina sp. SO4-13 TaxID=3401027 RepID=UPI003AF50D87
MTTEVRDRRALMLVALAIGALGTGLALTRAPGDVSLWIGATTGFVVFGGLWVLTAVLLDRATSPRWLMAFTGPWVRTIGVLAVVSLVVAVVPIWSMLVSPLTWTAVGALTLALASRDLLAASSAATIAVASAVLIQSWPIALLTPPVGAALVCGLGGALLIAVALVLSMRALSRSHRHLAR